MRICVYAIALNEILHVRRFLDTCADADLVVVGDTGSTDDTAEALHAGGATVHAISVKPWRFDVARNAVLSLLPPDVDVCIALDIDEVLIPGWRGRSSGFGSLARPRAATTSTPSHAGHEAVFPDRRTVEKHVHFKHLRIDHWPDRGKSRGQYLPLLEFCVQEDPYNARDAFTLGREYFFHGKHELAELELKRYFALPEGR